MNNDKPTKIIHLCQGNEETDAFYAYAKQLSEAQNKQGLESHVIGGLDWQNLSKAEFNKIISEICQDSPCTLHLHLPNQQLANVKGNILAGKEFVCHFHEFIYAKGLDELHNDLIENCTSIIVSDEVERREIAKRNPGAEKKCLVVPVGSNIPENEAIENKSSAKDLLYFGSIRRPKGVMELLNVAEEIGRRQQEASSPLKGVKVRILGATNDKHIDFLQEVLQKIYGAAQIKDFPKIQGLPTDHKKIMIRKYLANKTPLLPVEFIPEASWDEIISAFNDSKYFMNLAWRGATGHSGTLPAAANAGLPIFADYSTSIHPEYSDSIIKIDPRNHGEVVDALERAIRFSESPNGVPISNIIANAKNTIAISWEDIAKGISPAYQGMNRFSKIALHERGLP